MAAYNYNILDLSGNTIFPYTTSSAVYVDTDGRTLDNVLDKIVHGDLTIQSGNEGEVLAHQSLVFFKKSDGSSTKLFMIAGVANCLELGNIGNWENIEFAYGSNKFTITNRGIDNVKLSYTIIR